MHHLKKPVASLLVLAALAACTGDSDPVNAVPRDAVAPAVALTGPADGSFVQGYFLLEGTAADSAGIARITFQVDGSAEGDLPFVVPGTSGPDSTRITFGKHMLLSAGAHRVSVNAYDREGNRSTASATYTVDVAAPTFQVTPANGAVVNTDTVRVRATVTDDHRVQNAWLTVGEASYAAKTPAATVSIDTLLTLAVGQNHFTLRAIDGAKNESSVVVRFTRASGAVATFDAVVRSPSHGCGLRSGAAYCWGANRVGQLGTGNTVDRDVPVAVSGGLTFSSLDVAVARSCGVTTSAAIYCWGDNFYNVLGIGTDATFGHFVPKRVASDVSFAAVETGSGGTGYTTCALSTSGEAYCWGYNREGQAGVPRSTGQCNLAGVLTPCVATPTAVQGGLRFSSISVGGITCALTAEGAAYCWGPLGIEVSETPRAVAGGVRFKSIAAGSGGACGVSLAGQLYCWSSGAQPAPLAAGLSFRSVGTGYTFGGSGEIACALTEGGAVYCWDRDRPTPTPLEGGLTFVKVSTDHRCGLTADRKAYCWDASLRPVGVPGE